MANDDSQITDVVDDKMSDYNSESSNQMSSNKSVMTNQLQFILKWVIKQTTSHKFAAPFLKPVNGKIYTDYYQLISKPMDLGTIKKRLGDRWYTSASQCVNDFKQMFENCRTYNNNKNDPDILKMNDTLESFVMDKLSKMPPTEEVIQTILKPSKVPIKKAKTPAKGVTKVANGYESPPKNASSLTESSFNNPFHPQHHIDKDNMNDEKKLEDSRNVLKRRAESPTDHPMKRERNVKKVKYTENDDLMINQQPPPQHHDQTLSSSLFHCKKILMDMFQPPTSTKASFFYRPFDASLPQYQNYYQVVKRPIDLSFIQSKFQSNSYRSSKEFADDMRLMFSNCYRYFPSDAEIVYAARYLQDIFELNFARIPESPKRNDRPSRNICKSRSVEMDDDDDDDDDDEDDDEEYLAKLDKLRESLDKLQSELARMTEEGKLAKYNKQQRRQQKQYLLQQKQLPQGPMAQQQYLQQHQQLYTPHNIQSTNKKKLPPKHHAEADNDIQHANANNKNKQNNGAMPNNQIDMHHNSQTSGHFDLRNPNFSHTSAKENATPMTFEEIKKLSDDIPNLPAEQLLNMWMKLRSMELCVKDAKPDEIELDFFAFKLSTLRWLQDFVKPYQGNIDEKSNQNVMENDVTGQAKEHNFVSDHTSPQILKNKFHQAGFPNEQNTFLSQQYSSDQPSYPPFLSQKQSLQPNEDFNHIKNDTNASCDVVKSSENYPQQENLPIINNQHLSQQSNPDYDCDPNKNRIHQNLNNSKDFAWQQYHANQAHVNSDASATNYSPESINKLLRNITEASSDNQQAKPSIDAASHSTAISNVLTTLINSNGKKSSPFNQSDDMTCSTKSNKLKSQGSWSSLAQMSKNCDTVSISKKNSEQSFNLFKKQAEEKKERERQNREQEEQRRQKMEQFQQMKKEQEKQKIKEEEETGSSQTASEGNTTTSPANCSEEADAKVLSQEEKNRLREQERRKRAARAGLIDMNAQSILMADFEKDFKNS